MIILDYLNLSKIAKQKIALVFFINLLKQSKTVFSEKCRSENLMALK